MAKTPAERQAACLAKRRDLKGESQLNIWISSRAYSALGCIAKRDSVTKKLALETLLLREDQLPERDIVTIEDQLPERDIVTINTSTLTPALLVVYQLTQEGLTAAQIAAKLGKGKSTIENQRLSIRKKLSTNQ